MFVTSVILLPKPEGVTGFSALQRTFVRRPAIWAGADDSSKDGRDAISYDVSGDGFCYVSGKGVTDISWVGMYKVVFGGTVQRLLHPSL